MNRNLLKFLSNSNFFLLKKSFRESLRMNSTEIKPFLNHKNEKNLFHCQLPVTTKKDKTVYLDFVYQVILK